MPATLAFFAGFTVTLAILVVWEEHRVESYAM